VSAIEPSAPALAPAVPRAPRERIVELDALRGLAAVSVVLFHSFIIFPAAEADTRARGFTFLNVLKYSPVHALWAGPEAVLLFFVLSGFVLALPFLGPRRPGYLPFVIRRVTRLWPAYAVACILAFAAASAIGGAHIRRLSPWFNAAWQRPVNTGEVEHHLALIGHFSNGVFDPVLWSLVYEMRISIIFPIIVLVALRLRPKPLVWATLAWTFLAVAFATGLNVEGNYLLTLQYVPYFVVGIGLARYRKQLSSGLRASPVSLRCAFAAITVVLYTCPWWWAGAEQPGWLPAFWRTVFELAACAGFILIALGLPSASRLLRTAPLQYIGRISYSLYLVHAIVVLSLAHLLFGRVPTLLLLPLIWTAALLVATVVEITIERPSIALGRRLTRPRAVLAQAAPALAGD
jgi:peptidoglycan/LPS O-acetylase OafA/YrhL